MSYSGGKPDDGDEEVVDLADDFHEAGEVDRFGDVGVTHVIHSSAQVHLDGATAAIEAVLTDPAHRRAGLARALMLDALARAQAAGCDVVFLAAAADDWPCHWYTRLGFSAVSTRFEATRSS